MSRQLCGGRMNDFGKQSLGQCPAGLQTRCHLINPDQRGRRHHYETESEQTPSEGPVACLLCFNKPEKRGFSDSDRYA